MKRPFAVIGITYLLSQAVAAYFGTAFSLISVIVLALSAVLYGLFCEKTNKTVLAIMITAIIALTASYAYTRLYVETTVPLEGETVVIRGQVVEEPCEQYGRYYYVIRTESIEAENVHDNIKLRLSSESFLELDYSDYFEGAVTFSVIRNESSYASHKQLLSKGIIATAFMPGDGAYSSWSGSRGLYGIAISARGLLKDIVDDLYPDETGDLLTAMLTSDESDLDSHVISAFRNTGLAHILAVSGLHLTLLASAVTWLLRRFFLDRKIIAVIVCAVSWFFVSIAGFPMSSVRAAIMITVMLLGVLIDRQHSPLNSLGIALLIICLFNPYASINAGLLMSFSATFGLIVAAPELNRYFQRILFRDRMGIIAEILRSMLSSFIASFTASLFILPASVLYFGKVSLISPIANLALVPLSELFLGIGMIVVFLGLFGNIGRFAAYIFMTAGWIIGKLILGAVEILDKIPGAVLNTGSNTSLLVFGCVFIGILWALLFRNSRTRKRSFIAAVTCCFVIASVWYCSEKVLSDTHSVTVYSVGEAEMILARDGSSTVLIGAGGDSYDVRSAGYDMQDKGIDNINAFLITDLSYAGASGADEVIDTMKPCRVLSVDGGFYRDYVEYYTYKNQIALSEVKNTSVSAGAINVSTLPDDDGKIWSLIECGNIRVIVCPDAGNSLTCPFGRGFDAAVITGGLPSSVSYLDARVNIICSDYSSGAVLVSQLMSRGLENVYCTGTNGNIEITEREGRLYIGGGRI